MKILVFFLIFLLGCESYIYDDYKIIDQKKSTNYKKKDKIKKHYYLIQKGDNIYSISRKFKIPIHELIELNNILVPYKIYTNQKILIPVNKTHIIKKGDTLYSISRQYNSDVFSLSKLNNLRNANQIFIGQKIKIPNIGKKIKKQLIKKKEKVSIVKKLTKDNFLKEHSKNTSKSRFIWPVKGRLISKYGKKKDGFYNDGINIDSRQDSDVIASNDGEVIYSGNEIPGYGNLILIKHSKNWVTAYAHLNNVVIKKGSYVKKGEKIGSVGSTGNVRSPQLHFEIRKGKEAVDPLRFLS